MKRAGSGTRSRSVSQSYGSSDPVPDQTVTDPGQGSGEFVCPGVQVGSCEFKSKSTYRPKEGRDY
jgi:hypothetical protein